MTDGRPQDLNDNLRTLLGTHPNAVRKLASAGWLQKEAPQGHLPGPHPAQSCQPLGQPSLRCAGGRDRGTTRRRQRGVQKARHPLNFTKGRKPRGSDSSPSFCRQALKIRAVSDFPNVTQ